MRIVYLCHTIGEQQGVAIAPSIEFVKKKSLVFFILFGQEFLRAQEVAERVFARLLHRTLCLAHLLFIKTGNINLVNLDTVLLIDVNVNEHLVITRNVFALLNVNIGILKTLIFKVTLDDNLRTVYHVGGNLRTHLQTEAFFNIFALALLHT